MSTRSEEAAKKKYPKEEGKMYSTAFGTFEFDRNAAERKGFQQGYEEAEKDLAEFISLVKQMRHAQAEFRRTRISGWDYAAQKLEAKIDKLIKQLEDDTENKH